MISCLPTIRIGSDITVAVTAHGWPYWTSIDRGNHHLGLDPAEARALSDALVRIVAFLNAKEAEEREK